VKEIHASVLNPATAKGDELLKNRFNRATVLVLMALTAVVTIVIVSAYIREDYNRNLDEYSRQTSEMKAFIQAKEHIEKEFIGSSDPDAVMRGAVQGMIGSLGDQWSHYWSPEDYKTHTDDNKNTAGVWVELIPDAKKNGMKIIRVEPGSSAEGAGLRSGDIVIKIDGRETVGKSAEEITSWLQGPNASMVEISVLRDRRERN
jgi:C-terminal processing protease CtpA/Prc